MMPREIEYQLRALFFAVAMWTGLASYERRFHDEFWSEFPAALMCFHLAGLALLWWRGPQADIHPLIQAIKDLSRVISRAIHSKEYEAREGQAAERERKDGA